MMISENVLFTIIKSLGSYLTKLVLASSENGYFNHSGGSSRNLALF